MEAPSPPPPPPPPSTLMIPNSPFTLQAYQVKQEGDVSSLSENFSGIFPGTMYPFNFDVDLSKQLEKITKI